MGTRLVVSLIAAGLLSSPATARAEGLCENTPTTYALKSVSERLGQLVIRGSLAWCVEVDAGGELSEKRGHDAFAQRVGLDGEIARWFLADLKRETVARFVSAHQVEHPEALKALAKQEKAGGFVPAAKLKASPSGACAATVKRTDQPEVDEEFRQTTLSVAVRQGERTLWTHQVGASAIDAEPSVQVLFLPARRAVLVFSLLGSCGGPPPGMMDEEGDCYPEHEVGVTVVTVESEPALAACFKPAPAPPKPAPPKPAPPKPSPAP